VFKILYIFAKYILKEIEFTKNSKFNLFFAFKDLFAIAYWSRGPPIIEFKKFNLIGGFLF